MKNVKLEILMGLPASGKTTFGEQEQKKNSYSLHLINMDDIREELYYEKDASIHRCIEKGMSNRKNRNINTIMVDGLFLTNEHLKQVITAVADYYGEVDVIIHRWEEDRETCVKNDGGRREAKSINTILNAKYEEVDIDALNDVIKEWDCKITKVVNHKVQLKEDWYRFFKGHTYFGKDGKLRSYKWITGGAYGNCWDNHLSPVTPDDPLEFDALDELLEEVCPEITFLHYKKIRKNCVSTEESYESDYYGGGTNHMNWVCDLRELYNVLEELGYDVHQN